MNLVLFRASSATKPWLYCCRLRTPVSCTGGIDTRGRIEAKKGLDGLRFSGLGFCEMFSKEVEVKPEGSGSHAQAANETPFEMAGHGHESAVFSGDEEDAGVTRGSEPEPGNCLLAAAYQQGVEVQGCRGYRW